MSTLYVNVAWAAEAAGTVLADGKIIGVDAFGSVTEAMNAAVANGSTTIKLESDVAETLSDDLYFIVKNNIEFVADKKVTVALSNNGTNYDVILNSDNENTITFGANVTFTLDDRIIWAGYYGNNVDVVINGTVSAYQWWNGTDTTVNAGGKLVASGEAMVFRRGATLTVVGDAEQGAAAADRTVQIDANYFNFLSGNLIATDALIEAGAVWVSNTGSYTNESTVWISLDNTILNSTGNLKLHSDQTALMEVTNGSVLNVTNFDGYGASEIGTNGFLWVYDSTATLKDLNNAGDIDIADSSFTVNGTLTNNGAFAVGGESTLDIAKVVGNDIVASGVLKDSKLTMEKFDWETGNVMVDGALKVQNGTFSNVQFRADEGETVTISGKVVAAGATQFKAVNGEVILEGEFTSDVSEASSIEIEGSDAKLTVNKDGKAKITGGFYLNGGTTQITGNLSEDADLAALKREDAQIDAAYSTWGGSYAANVTLTDTYVWNAMISLNNADTVVTVDNSLLVGWMSFDINGGKLLATNGSFVNHQAAEGWTRFAIGVDGALVITDGSTFDAAKTNLTNNGSITVDATSTFIANTITGEGTITVDAANFAGGFKKVIDLSGTTSLEGKVTLENADGAQLLYGADGDVFLAAGAGSTLYVNYAWAGKAVGEEVDGKTFGFDAFATVHQAINAATDKTSRIEVVEGEAALYKKVTTANPDGLVIDMGDNGVTVNKNSAIVDADGNDAEASVYSYITDGAEIGSGVTVNADILFPTWQDIQIDGIVNVNGACIQCGKVVIGAAGELNVRDLLTLTASGSELVVEGNFTAGEVHFRDSTYGSAFTVANGGVATVTDLILFTSGSELNVEEGGKLYVTNVSVESMNVAAGGEIAINAAGVTETTKMLDVDTIANAGTLTVENLEDGMFTMTAADGDIWVVANTIYVDGSWAADTAFGTEVAEGKIFGVNAFASLESISTEASQGIRKVFYTASQSGSLTLTVEGEKYTAYTIDGEKSYVMAGKVKNVTMAVEEGTVYTFEFTNAEGDFELSTSINPANESVVIEDLSPIADDDVIVAPGTGAKSYEFTVETGFTADFHFVLETLDGSITYTLTDEQNNVVYSSRTMGKVDRTISDLEAGTYKFAVDTYAGDNSQYNLDANFTVKEVYEVSASYISDADDTSDTATVVTFADLSGDNTIANWVGLEDSVDWYQITEFTAGASTTFTLNVDEGGSRTSAMIYSQVGNGRVRQVRSLSTTGTGSVTLTMAADTKYFVKVSSLGSSDYTMQLA